jgi:hypothetical protein
MPTEGELVAAVAAGLVEEVQTLILGGANIEETDAVSDGVRAGIERFLCCRFCFAQWCEFVNDERPRA